MIRKTALVIALLSPLPAVCSRAAEGGAELIEVKNIWDQAPHCAFTDLLRLNDTCYCVFRESTAHIPGLDGKIRVLRTTDGTKWESLALIAEKGIDLRDPKISVTPDGRLMLLMGGSVYGGGEPTPGRKRISAYSRVSFSSNATEWSTPQPVSGIGDDQWLWQMAWHKGTGYAAVYSTTKVEGKRIFTVWKTTDGVK